MASPAVIEEANPSKSGGKSKSTLNLQRQQASTRRTTPSRAGDLTCRWKHKVEPVRGPDYSSKAARVDLFFVDK